MTQRIQHIEIHDRPTGRCRRRQHFLFCSLAMVALSLSLISCRTLPEDRESEIPWNAPATWEGTPGIPGLGGGEY